MIEREILKDTGQYEPKFIAGLTVRQCVCLALGTIVTVPVGLLLNKFFVINFSIPIAGMVGAPIYMCGWYKPYGIPFEKFIFMILKTAIMSPKKRKYIIKADYLTPDEKPLTKKEIKAREKKYQEDKKKYSICK